MMTITATYIGNDSVLFLKDQTYNLIIENFLNYILIRKVDTSIIYYSNFILFLNEWDNIKQLK